MWKTCQKWAWKLGAISDLRYDVRVSYLIFSWFWDDHLLRYKCIFAKCANIGKVLLPTVSDGMANGGNMERNSNI